MDRNEKKRARDHISQRLDVSNTRLTDTEASFLVEFVDTYDEQYRGHTETRTRSHDSFSSDGRYTRTETFTDTFTDDVGIRQDYAYRDDDGQHGSSTTQIKDARGILNWIRDHG